MDRLARPFEVKFADDGEPGTFSGYGSVFGKVDSYGDTIIKGAFRDTLRQAKKTGIWPAMLSQHGGGADDMMPIGIWTKMEEDDTGLRVEGKLAIETQRGRDAYSLLKMEPRPALNGLSIGFLAKEFTLGTKPDEPRRTLKKIELLEVSLVTFPADLHARIDGVKAANLTERELERLLTQDAGMSRSEARALMRGGYQALKAKQDAGDEGSAMAALLDELRSARKAAA